jgi:hypothetical protein
MPVTIPDQMRQAIQLAGWLTGHRTAAPAMRIADPAARDPRASQRLRPHAQNPTAEPSLTASSNRPRIQIAPDDQPPGSSY